MTTIRSISTILLVAVIIIVQGKQYTFDHAYDPETKYEAPSVHFENLVGQRYECIQDIQRAIIATFKPYIGGKELIGYADPAINSNLGDQLLWAGSNKLFQRFGKKAVLHCGGSQSKKVVDSCLDEKSSLVKTLGNGKGVLWFNPGGNWGDMYRNIHNNRLQVWEMAWENKIPFISGPQSIWYDPDKKKGVQVDNEIIKKIATKGDLLTFRQKDSYQFAVKHYGNFTNVAETPDISFMLGPQVEHDSTVLDVFMLVRTDSESRMTEHFDKYDSICKGISKKGYTCAIGDWGTGSKIKTRKHGSSPDPEDATGYVSDIGVQVAISTISIGELIVTDHLHGAILAFLMGKTVVYIDNSYKKLHAVFESAFRDKVSCADQKTFGLFEIPSLETRAMESFIIKLLMKKRVN